MTAKVMYKITWCWPGGSPSGWALAPYDSARALEASLTAAGYDADDVTVSVAEARPAGRQSTAHVTGAVFTGHDDLDAGDRAAMGRLARRAVGYTDPAERYDEDR